MFREIRTSEYITERDRRKEEDRKRELENIQRIAGRHYSDAEFNDAKLFILSLFEEKL